ncbi:MAG: YggS family pyridoxal phosphate-dependent enzyme [Flavobacteriaceae bacterium]|nr:YggS family pyridoxal phosphate-dependent enzyme [Flavobacteriaceae bacterium]MCY4266287.1 YggS family pyridoxal phosphate-dependent enzyme [Flavobacteriaceae bacterium]MCY4298094.1 YggS family pyridoxal phosphate-dependent enzyme [Flavobacteriaceae bacterium]
MSIVENLNRIKKSIPSDVKVIAVSKTKTFEDILKAYHTGHRDFGENKVQELIIKQSQLPHDIRWHMVGHLQTNKVKYIAPFVSLIHSVDSLRLLKEINKQGIKNNRKLSVLLQVKIALEVTKFGINPHQLESLIHKSHSFEAVKIEGLMGMASFVDDKNQLDKEFGALKYQFSKLKTKHPSMKVLSMGMTQDYQQAITHGSTMVRIGRKIFGERST